MTESELRARVLAAVRETPSATRAEERRRAMMIGSAGVVVTVVLFVIGGVHVGTRPAQLVLSATGLAVSTAIVLTFVAGVRSRSMLGRPRSVLVGAILAALAVLGVSAFMVLMGWNDGEAVSLRSHVLCGLFTVLQGSALFASLFLLRRGSDPVHPAVTGAALGMTAGAWTVTMAYLRCQHADAVHCVAAHVIPALLFAAFGAFLGRAVLKLR